MPHTTRVTSTTLPAAVEACPTFSTRPATTACPTVAVSPVSCPVSQSNDLLNTLLTQICLNMLSGTTPLTAATQAAQTTPTTTAAQTGQGTIDQSLLSLLSGLTGGAQTQAAAATLPAAGGATEQVFTNPIAQLGGVSPFAALAASNPNAALAALSPSLNIFNPAVNPNAALLQFNPAAAKTMALSAKQGLATLPFGTIYPFGKGKYYGIPGAAPYAKPYAAGYPYGVV